MIKYYSVEDIERDYIRTSQGHWFDKDTKKFFKTRFTDAFRILDEKNYLFVTTEKSPFGDRKASLRLCKVTPDKKKHCGYRVDIHTIGNFNSMTLYEAKKLMLNYNHGE